MRKITDIIKSYNENENIDRRKKHIVEWFLKNPERQIDRRGLFNELDDEIDVGPRSFDDTLDELVDDNILEEHGSQRITYTLCDDIVVPVKYQVKAGLRAQKKVLDQRQVGILGVLAITTVMWGIFTATFWFFSFALFLLPQSEVVTLSLSDTVTMAVLMSIWLITMAVVSYAVMKIRRFVVL